MGSQASSNRNKSKESPVFSSRMERSVKMPLKPGHGLMDWIRLCQQNPNMAARPDGQPMRVTENDMAEHSRKDNAWMIINGKVYNVAPYMEYHPGGAEQLMRAAGTDGTKLFNEKHPWVNYESMLKSCFVGYFAGALSKLKPPAKEVLDMDRLTLGASPSTGTADNFLSLPGQIQYPKSLVDLGINCTWREDSDGVQLLFDTPWKQLSIEHTVVECMNSRKLRVVFRTATPPSEVIWTSTGVTTPGRVSVCLQKQDAAILWPEFLHNCVVSSSKGRKYRTCRIRKIGTITPDTKLFSIDFPAGSALPIPVGSHVFIRIHEDERPYTPVTLPSAPSNGVSSTALHLLIKVYQNGRFTPNLWKLTEGDTLEISDHEGSFNVNKFLDHYNIYLLAAGTGFTPMVRIIQHCLHKSKKNVTLLFFNKTENDIPWREELDRLSEQSNQFRLIHVLSSANEKWQGRKERVSLELLSEFLLPAINSNFVCVCGPNGFVESCVKYLTEMRYDDSNIHLFQG